MWKKEVGQESKAVTRSRQVVASASYAPRRTGVAGHLLGLQRTRGNRFVQNLLGRARVQPKCDCGGGGGMCAACAQKDETIQRSAAHESEDAQMMKAASPIVNEVIGSVGHPLDDETREFMETRFGHDFSGVRVHTDARAAESARAVNAVAYTVGQDVVFDEGLYQPQTQVGRHLLAHELTHVVQQSGAPVQGELTVSQPHDKEELEAESMAKSVMQMGESVPSRAGNLSFTGRRETGSHLAFLASGLRRAHEEHDLPTIELLERTIDLVETQSDAVPFNHTHAEGRSVGGGCSACTAQPVQRQAAPQREGHLSRATVARRSTVQCINANLANAGIPWAVIAIAGGICGLIGAIAGLAGGPAAPATSPGGAALGAATCIAGVTGASIGLVLGVITRCIQDPSVEWVFAQAETTGAGGGGSGGGEETATA